MEIASFCGNISIPLRSYTQQTNSCETNSYALILTTELSGLSQEIQRILAIEGTNRECGEISSACQPQVLRFEMAITFYSLHIQETLS